MSEQELDTTSPFDGEACFQDAEARAFIGMYLRTRNGWFFWKAYLEYRRLGQPVPDALMTKLDQIAQRLIEAEGQPEIAMAVEMSAKRQGAHGTILAQRNLRTRLIVQRVHDRVAAGQSEADAFNRVAKQMGKSPRQIGDAYRKWMQAPTSDAAAVDTMELERLFREPIRPDS